MYLFRLLILLVSPLHEVLNDVNALYLFTKKRYRRLRKTGLWGSLVDIGHTLLGWLLRFSSDCLLVAIMAVAMIESLWDNEQIDWWRE